MTDVAAVFEKHHEAEFIEFERIEKPRSKRRDLHAFMLLDELAPGTGKIVAAAEHDEIWIEVSPEAIEHATEEQIIELIRCGVMLDSDTDSFHMFA